MTETNMVLNVVPSNNFTSNVSNGLPSDVQQLMDILNRSYSGDWRKSKEKTRVLNSIWVKLFKGEQEKLSVTVNQYANMLPFSIEANLKNVALFFEQLQMGDRIAPYLYARICEELNLSRASKLMPKEKLFQLYLDKVVIKILKKLLEYYISELNFKQRIHGSELGYN